MKEIFEWNRLFYNNLPETFILEVIFRSTVMFTILLLTLKLAGKRGVKQLSVFETVIIIALGSAAGDPMFYEDVGIIPASNRIFKHYNSLSFCYLAHRKKQKIRRVHRR
ncbi:hypothetical protein [Flavobacterium ginsengisoli]|uniref:hypothetical protein n=1 Tax=Flavobacterium ginsengisoli TaxID=871694 RepID=UPI002414DC78|nr:hypothetical protein [Flavobacterium ginsengisoli]